RRHVSGRDRGRSARQAAPAARARRPKRGVPPLRRGSRPPRRTRARRGGHHALARRIHPVRFAEVTLAGPPELTAFYRDELGLPVDAGAIRIGETLIRFRSGGDDAFYHFAFLIPGDRFAAALAWAEERVELLKDQDGTPVFVGDEWKSSAVYFHDPAGNIGELIAHHGLEENGRAGAFAADELVGLSELGLVGDRRALLRRLEALGLSMFSGAVDGPERIAF